MTTRTPPRQTAAPSAPARKAPAAKTAATAPAAAPAKNAAVDKKAPKLRAKLVRDGFTMPENDFALITVLKQRAMLAGREAKKSELLRAGLQALAGLNGPSLQAALNALAPLKPGRPRKSD